MVMANPVIHFEIPADDLERLKKFYADLFGWGMKTSPNMPGYVMVETVTDGMGISGGIMKKKMPTQPPVNYVAVASVIDYANKLTQLGCQVVVPRTPIPGMGYFAVGLDPEGNPIGLFEMDSGAA
jgi:hypothetical protein